MAFARICVTRQTAVVYIIIVYIPNIWIGYMAVQKHKYDLQNEKEKRKKNYPKPDNFIFARVHIFQYNATL